MLHRPNFSFFRAYWCFADHFKDQADGLLNSLELTYRRMLQVCRSLDLGPVLVVLHGHVYWCVYQSLQCDNHGALVLQPQRCSAITTAPQCYNPSAAVMHPQRLSATTLALQCCNASATTLALQCCNPSAAVLNRSAVTLRQFPKTFKMFSGWRNVQLVVEQLAEHDRATGHRPRRPIVGLGFVHHLKVRNITQYDDGCSRCDSR